MAVNRQHLHVCVKEPRVKIRISGVARTGLDGIGPYRNKKDLELELAFVEHLQVLMYIQSELMHLGVQEPLLESAGLSTAAPGTGEQAN